MHAIIREIIDNSDRRYDPFGAGMMTLGALCDVLYVEGADIPAEAGYRPAWGLGIEAMTDDDSGEFYWQRELLAGLHPEDFPGYWIEGYHPDLSVEDIEHAARVLSRYLDLVKLAGKDY